MSGGAPDSTGNLFGVSGSELGSCLSLMFSRPSPMAQAASTGQSLSSGGGLGHHHVNRWHPHSVIHKNGRGAFHYRGYSGGGFISAAASVLGRLLPGIKGALPALGKALPGIIQGFAQGATGNPSEGSGMKRRCV